MGMSANDRTTRCFLCNKGRVVTRMEELNFRQWSDKGYVHCRVMVPMEVCDNCGAKSLGEAAVKVMDDAFQSAYEALP